MQTASLLLVIQNDRQFMLKIGAELVESAFDADRSDWKMRELPRGSFAGRISGIEGMPTTLLRCYPYLIWN